MVGLTIDRRSLARLCPLALRSRREAPLTYRPNGISGEWWCLAQRPDILNDALRGDCGLEKYLTATHCLKCCGQHRAALILWRVKLPEDDASKGEGGNARPGQSQHSYILTTGA